MFRSSNFDKILENATSHLRLEPDWQSILNICDAIRQNEVSAKQAFAAIKKKMTSQNPHSAFYALLVLESVVKNCGLPMHEEIFTKENCDMFSSFLQDTPHENVREKMLELVQTWAYAFRSSEKCQAIKDTMSVLKARGHTFPELKEADAMFTADTAPEWADGKVCNRCRVDFKFTQRKHHCRNCGQIFCGQCSAKQCPLPKYGIEKDVRVCDGCFANLQKPASAKRTTSDNELPVEYLNSTLAQQPQNPPRKTEEELKEEEELQLALALSQSEAEIKNNKKNSSSLKSIQQNSYTDEIPKVATVSPPITIQDQAADADLAKYMNRSYWEQKKMNQSPASPSAPSPMPQLVIMNTTSAKSPSEDDEIDDFAINMKSHVDIFVNRMKSNSSRGRNISNDSSVQTLFMKLTSLHSQLLTYIKQMDDKRMWCEQLQDKLTQVKDSRAALDVLRQEHLEKMRRAAEEQERQRQLQMAHKLEIMRKKKQEYLQYQRQLALQRIQEQEREMQIRQEQQKAQYRIGQVQFPYAAAPAQQRPNNPQMGGVYVPFGYNGAPVPLGQYPPQSQNHQQQQMHMMPQPGHMPEMYMATQHNMNMPPTHFISNPAPNQMPNFVDNAGQADKNLPNLQPGQQQIINSNFTQNAMPPHSNPIQMNALPPTLNNNNPMPNPGETAIGLTTHMPVVSQAAESEQAPQASIATVPVEDKPDEVTTAELIKFD